MEEKQADLLGHPDKVEVSLVNSAGNALLLPKLFPLLVALWTKKFFFRWNARLSGSTWTISGWSHEFRATFSGWSKDVADNPAWKENPFGGPTFRLLYGGSRRGTTSSVRFTTPNKNDPVGYLQKLALALVDLEVLGIQERPSLLEVALDSYGDPTALRTQVRLTRDKPQDFRHWRGGSYEPGGSRDGNHTEYSMRNAFLADHQQGRELVCYRRSEFYRVELRLGRKPLLRFLRSPAYEKAAESSATPPLLRNYTPKAYSPTLDLLHLLPLLAAQHLQFETFDLARIRAAYPASAYWRLKGTTTRQVRFLLAQHKLSQAQMARFARKAAFPRVRWLFPTLP